MWALGRTYISKSVKGNHSEFIWEENKILGLCSVGQYDTSHVLHNDV